MWCGKLGDKNILPQSHRATEKNVAAAFLSFSVALWLCGSVAISFHLEGVFVGRERLIKNVVFDRHLNIVEARLEFLERDQARQRHLLAVDRAQSPFAVLFDPHDLFAFLRNYVFDVHARPQRRLVDADVVDLHVNAESLILFEFRMRVRDHLERAEHVLAAGQTPVKRLDLRSQDQGRGRKLALFVFRDREAQLEDAGLSAVHVAHDHVGLVIARLQYDVLVVGRLHLLADGERFGREARSHDVLEQPGAASGDVGDLGEDVDRRLRQPADIFVNQVLIRHLDGEGSQHGVFGHAHKVDIQNRVEHVEAGLRQVGFGDPREFVESDLRWPRQFGEQVEFFERVVFGPLAEELIALAARAESAVSDAVGLRRQAELFGQRQTRVRRVKQRVLFIGAAGDAVFARAGRVDKFDLDVRTYSLDVAIPPDFEWIGRRRAAAFPGGSVIAAARRVRFDLIGLTEHDVDAPPVGLPSGNAAGVMFVGVGDALVIFFAVFVDVGVGVWVAAVPEPFDELLAFVVGLERVEDLALLIGDDPANVFVLPASVNALDFLFLRFFFLLFSLLLFLLFLLVLILVLSEGSEGRQGERRERQRENQKQRDATRRRPYEKSVLHKVSLLSAPPDAALPLGFVWDVIVRTRATGSLARPPAIFSHLDCQQLMSA